MNRGIYITANDRVIEQAIALLNSIRFYDPETPIVMIPYDDQYHAIADLLAECYGVQVYEDLEFIDRLSKQLHQIFGDKFFARPNQFRKQACWYGPFDEFLYIDTDIVVFEKIIDRLNYLQDYDFICCDYQYAGDLKNVFTPKILEDKVFTPEELKGIFNGGFWGSKKNLISEAELYQTFAECASHTEYFDFSQKTSDQPIINYMILKRVSQKFNLVRIPGGGAGSWAGSPQFKRQGNILIDPDANNSPLQYLHWAGIQIAPGCPYWDIWEYYRYLNSPQSLPVSFSSPSPKKDFWQTIKDKIKSKF